MSSAPLDWYYQHREENKMFTITFNEGKTTEKTEVCRPLKENGSKTLIAYIKGARVATAWVNTDRIVKSA